MDTSKPTNEIYMHAGIHTHGVCSGVDKTWAYAISFVTEHMGMGRRSGIYLVYTLPGNRALESAICEL